MKQEWFALLEQIKGGSMMNTTVAKRFAIVALACMGAAPTAAQAADPYVIGLTGDMTGPDAGNSGAVADTVRIYFEKVNERGGINGHPVQVIIRDNQSQPSRAASDAQEFVNDPNLLIIVTASLSSTYVPTISESKQHGVPVLFAGGVCPTEVFPPANPLLFCTSGYAADKDAEYAVDYVRSVSPGNVTVGFVSMAIPISRGGMEHGAAVAESKGMKVGDHEIIPPTTVSFSPYATKLKAADVDWVISWAPWITQVKAFEALRELGWQGKFITYAHNVAEEELKRIKDPGFLVFGTNAMFIGNQPVHQDIIAAAQGKTKFPYTYLNEGWIASITLEAALKKVPWPPTRAKLVEVMNDLTIDMRGMRGGPIVWTKDNHFRRELFYRVYGWNSTQNSIEVVKDWVRMDVK